MFRCVHTKGSDNYYCNVNWVYHNYATDSNSSLDIVWLCLSRVLIHVDVFCALIDVVFVAATGNCSFLVIG